MTRETLLDFFHDMSSSDDTFVVHDDGYRVRRITYRQLASAARDFTQRLVDEHITAGDKVVTVGSCGGPSGLAISGA